MSDFHHFSVFDITVPSNYFPFIKIEIEKKNEIIALVLFARNCNSFEHGKAVITLEKISRTKVPIISLIVFQHKQ